MKSTSPYIGTTEEEAKEMLKAIGIENLEELYENVPENLKLKKNLRLHSPQGELPFSEMELKIYMEHLSSKNANSSTHKLFRGAGCYNHYVPQIVDFFLGQPEFFTPYTPYKPEANQGTLQALFEYQTLMCMLTGMEVANSSLYDGSTAMVEAAKMASRLKGKKEILISKSIHPEYRQVFKTYFQFGEWTFKEIELRNGKTDIKDLESKINDDTATVIIQNPNFFGIFEGMDKKIAEKIHKKDALYINLVVESLAMALIRPADFGADIVAGEAQSFGNHMNLGGPHLGFITCQSKHKRQLPGRIVNKTTDKEGKTAYMLWGGAREQHVSRDKATSNICSNHALNALAAAIYLVYYGKKGLTELAEKHNMEKARYAYDKIRKVKGYKSTFPRQKFFNEFAITCPYNVDNINRKLLEYNIIGGINLERYYPELKNSMLLCITEKTSKDDIDKLVDLLKHFNKGGVQ